MEKLLTPGDVMAMLQCERKKLYRLIKSGLPTLRIGGEYRFRPAQVEAFLRANEVRLPGRRVERSQQGVVLQ